MRGSGAAAADDVEFVLAVAAPAAVLDFVVGDVEIVVVRNF